jgi:hypothetical protein
MFDGFQLDFEMFAEIFLARVKKINKKCVEKINKSPKIEA